MFKICKKNIRLWIIVAVLFVTNNVCAYEIKGVSFSENHLVDQTELTLKGVAVLKWGFLFDVYAGAFYLPEGISGQNWTEDVPKRLELSYFLNFKAEDFSESSDKLLRSSLSDAEYAALAERLQKFYQLFRDIKPGDRYSLTYRYGSGTELRLNGELLGVAPGADFAVAYFGLWLGSQPINEKFRNRLLNGLSG